MVWTGFRPSDDPVRYHYNIPDNMFAAVVMRDLTSIARDVWRDPRMAENAWGLSVEIQRGIEQYGTVHLDGFGRIYAYEVDGRGHANVMDDANVPSLLSIPYFGYLPKTNSLYLATRRFVLSPRNPYFFSGKYAQGIGSPHTPHGYVWPLALVRAGADGDEPGRGRQSVRLDRRLRRRRSPAARVVQRRLAGSVHARRLRLAERDVCRTRPRSPRRSLRRPLNPR